MNTSLTSCGIAAVTDKAVTYYQPRLEVTKTDAETVVLVELPGVTLDGLELSVENNELYLEAKSIVGASEAWRALHRESSDHAYRLRLRLGESVNHASIGATLADGVLTLSFPKAGEAKPRKIKIK